MIDKASLRGVTVATILPFTSDGRIDWPGFDRVLAYCAAPDRIAAVFVNGHAGEVNSLSALERVDVIRRARAVIGPKKPLLAGVVPHGVTDAIEQAFAAQAAGADAYVMFPPAGLGGGAATAPDAPEAYFRAVTSGVEIPASIFQYPLSSGFGFSTPALLAIASLPKVIAIKEGSNSMLAYEENFRALQSVCSKVAVLPSNFDWFLPQLAVGADGLLSGLASLTPLWLADLWDASERLDLSAMRLASDRLYPIVRTIYGAAPIIDMHTRIKVGLQTLGLIDFAGPRLPLLPVKADVADSVVAAIKSSGLRAFFQERYD